jgi:putative aldouronate transport system permease protein
MRRITNKKDFALDFSIYLVLLILGVSTLYPFWNILVLSFNDAIDAVRGGIYLFPRELTLNNFKTVLALDSLPRAFLNSVLRTVTGAVLSVLSVTMLAYTLSRRDYIFRKVIQKMFVITMYVGGGLIPYYFVIRGLGLRNNFLVYILPMLLNGYYVIVARSFMDTIPKSLEESAKIDGANDFTIYCKIIMPLSLPVIATIVLFAAVDQWNSWFDSFIFVNNKKLTTLQYELVKIISRSSTQVQNIDQLRYQIANRNVTSTPQSIQMAITIVATTPILLVYPFIQKYFIKGMTLGAVKE